MPLRSCPAQPTFLKMATLSSLLQSELHWTLSFMGCSSMVRRPAATVTGRQMGGPPPYHCTRRSQEPLNRQLKSVCSRASARSSLPSAPSSSSWWGASHSSSAGRASESQRVAGGPPQAGLVQVADRHQCSAPDAEAHGQCMPIWQPWQRSGPTRVVDGPRRLWAVLIAQWIHDVAAALAVQHKPCVLPPRFKPPAAGSALWTCLA